MNTRNTPIPKQNADILKPCEHDQHCVLPWIYDGFLIYLLTVEQSNNYVFLNICTLTFTHDTSKFNQ